MHMIPVVAVHWPRPVVDGLPVELNAVVHQYLTPKMAFGAHRKIYLFPERLVLVGHSKTVSALCFGRSDTELLSASTDLTIRVWHHNVCTQIINVVDPVLSFYWQPEGFTAFSAYMTEFTDTKHVQQLRFVRKDDDKFALQQHSLEENTAGNANIDWYGLGFLDMMECELDFADVVNTLNAMTDRLAIDMFTVVHAMWFKKTLIVTGRFRAYVFFFDSHVRQRRLLFDFEADAIMALASEQHFIFLHTRGHESFLSIYGHDLVLQKRLSIQLHLNKIMFGANRNTVLAFPAVSQISEFAEPFYYIVDVASGDLALQNFQGKRT